MKKLNSFVSLATVVMTVIHIMAESGLMLGIIQYSKPITYISRIAGALFITHTVLSLIIMFFFTAHGGFKGSIKYNIATVLQRASALLLMLLIHIHGLSWMLLPMTAVVCLHMAVSIPRAMITLGITTSEKSIFVTRRICGTLCALLLMFSAVSIFVYMI